MKCPQCQTDASDDSRFCAHCGTPLALDETRELVPGTISIVPDSAPVVKAARGRWAPGEVLLDDYRVERELGHGGMGVVYLVRSQATGQPFAVKTMREPDERRRRLFLKELYTWLDLPRHPHLVACRFFRTIDETLVIFSEFVSGGSLADAIERGQLNRLDRLLDVAIQFAWGLAIAHQAGVVHRDVKPDNVLMSREYQAMVSDFGLSSARSALAGGKTPGGGLAVTSTGMTLPYRSPEQSRGDRLTRHTDVWSWGVSVLEMFAGGRQWTFGEEAPAFLEAATEDPTQLATPLPDGLAEVLLKCFRPNPGQRWDSLLEAAAELEQIYQQLVGQPYPRTLPRTELPWRDDAELSRYFQDPDHDALHWLEEAVEVNGGDRELAATFFKGRHHSQAAHLAEQIAGFDEARRIFERAIAEHRTHDPNETAQLFLESELLPSGEVAGRFSELADTYLAELRERLARLCVDAAFVHRQAADYSGALALYDRALEARKQASAGSHDDRWTSLSMLIWHDQAQTLECAGSYASARALFDQAIHRALTCPADLDSAAALTLDGHLAQLYLGKATVCFRVKDYTSALGLHDRAIEILKRILEFTPQAEVAELLVRAFRDKAATLTAVDDQDAALQALSTAGMLQNNAGLGTLGLGEASGLEDQAAVLLAADPGAAASLCRQAIEVYERIVIRDQQHLFATRLARSHANLALALARQGDHAAALGEYDKALQMVEQIVGEHGRLEVERELIRLRINRAISQRELGRRLEAQATLDTVVSQLQRLRQGADEPELDHHLALALSDNAYLASLDGRQSQAAELFRQACDLWRRLVRERGYRQMERFLDLAEENLRNLA